MANKFGADILIQAQDPPAGGAFCVEQLGFEITDRTPTDAMIGLRGQDINLCIERGPALGPVPESETIRNNPRFRRS